MPSRPDPADVLVASFADRVTVVALRGDAGAALELVKDLHEHRSDVQLCLRYAMASAPTTPDRRRSPMPARYPGRCSVCAAAVMVGMPIYFDAGQVTHARCG